MRCLVQAASLGQRLAATNATRQASPSERAPHERADVLIDAERHQLPLVVAADQRVVRLMRDEPAIAVAVGRSEEHTSELQSRENLVCRLLLEKKKNKTK